MMELTTIILIIMATILLIGWILKAYFNLNKNQIKQHSKKSFIDSVTIDVINEDTITESNNELSKKSFDGVNMNLEKGKISSKNNKNIDLDIAHESSLAQGYVVGTNNKGKKK